MGPIHTIMEILHETNKGRTMDTLEKYHIYKETHVNNQINDKNTVKPNAIFDIVVQHQYTQGASRSSI
jgi:3-methyladenine DNA glycosylase AlkC